MPFVTPRIRSAVSNVFVISVTLILSAAAHLPLASTSNTSYLSAFLSYTYIFVPAVRFAAWTTSCALRRAPSASNPSNGTATYRFDAMLAVIFTAPNMFVEGTEMTTGSELPVVITCSPDVLPLTTTASSDEDDVIAFSPEAAAVSAIGSVNVVVILPSASGVAPCGAQKLPLASPLKWPRCPREPATTALPVNVICSPSKLLRLTVYLSDFRKFPVTDTDPVPSAVFLVI